MRSTLATGGTGASSPLVAAPGCARPNPLYAQLRPRRNGPDRELVASNQRARLLGAMIEEVAERGYNGATLSRLTALAGVSKRAFYEHFGTKEAYFLAAYDAIVARAVQRVSDAYGRGGDWEERLRGAFESFAAEVVNEPKAARLALVEALGAGPVAVARMQRTRLVFEQMVAASLAEPDDGVALPPLVVKGIACGIERITRQRLLAGRARELPALADELLAWVLSYRCAAAAQLPALAAAHRNAGPPSRPPARAVNERTRILAAGARVAAARGYAHLTPERIAEAAGVSEESFHELFESSEQCLLDALDRLGLEALVCAAEAARGGGDRCDGVRRGIVALMAHLASNPVLVRIAFVEVFAIGPPGRERREALLDGCVDLLARSLPRCPGRPSPLAVEASVGAVWGIVHHHVTRDATHLLPGLADYATYMALAPTIGGDDAMRAMVSAG